MLNTDLRQMFAAHARRFTFNAPPNLESFLGDQPDKIPCENVTVSVHAANAWLPRAFGPGDGRGIERVWYV